MKWVLLFIFPQILWAIDTCNDGWKIAYGANKNVNCHGTCWNIKNNISGGGDIFVPTKTSTEYNAFNNNTPAGVTKSGCFATYLPWYPQRNIPETTVTNGGWQECYKLGYESTANRSTIEAACNRDRVMVACRRDNNATLQLLGQATRRDVFYNTAEKDDGNYTYPANGVGWYYGTKSIGFAYNMDTVSRSSCDNPASGNLDYRLCRHSSNTQIQGGWRCGANTSLSSGWETVWYHANGADPAPECNDYKTIQDDNRYVRNTNSSPIMCDNATKLLPDNTSPVKAGWHKFFTNSGPFYKIPNNAPPEAWRSQTHAPGWLEGADPTAGAVNTRTAYFTYSTSTKYGSSAGIETRSCADGSLVYNLNDNLGCSFRYSTMPHNGIPSGCYTYMQISDTTRHTNYTSNPGTKCDRDSGEVIATWGGQGTWFYFSTGSRTVPHSPPTVSRCSTSATGWLNFASPATNAVTSGQACFNWSGSSCWSTVNNAQQANCGSYNVYQLPTPTNCDLRYCVDP